MPELVSRRGFLSLLAGAVVEPVARKVFVLPPPGGWRPSGSDGGGLLVMESTARGMADFDEINAVMLQYIVPPLSDIYFRTIPLFGQMVKWDGERRVVVTEPVRWEEALAGAEEAQPR